MVERLFIALGCLLVGFSLPVHASPDIKSWLTDSGAKVLYVHAPELPMVDVRVTFDAGSARDEKLPGVASFTSDMMSEGAGDWNADQLAVRLEDRGIELGSGSARDMAWVTLRSLTEPKTLEVALGTMATVLAKPRFATEDIERVRQQKQVGLAHMEQSPSSIGKRAFMKTIYGDHPYAHNSIGTEKSLAEIQRKDLVAFHKQYFVAKNAVIAIVGDLNTKAAKSLSNRLMAGLEAGEKASKLPQVSAAKQALIEKQYPSSQTHIFLGQPGMAKHDPDYFPLYVGNHVFGGSGLVSLLGEEVRNKRGLSYSVYSYFSPMRAAGPFIMSAQTKNDQAEQTLTVMRDTLQAFIDDGPTDEELNASILNITGGFPLQVSSNGKIIGYISMMGFYDYPLDWLETLTTKVAAVTKEQVRDAFQRRVDPGKLTAVVVGG